MSYEAVLTKENAAPLSLSDQILKLFEEPSDSSEIAIKEVLQCGHTWLFKVWCIGCGDDTLLGFPLGFCPTCKKDFSKRFFTLKEVPKRLLAGAKRTNRASIGKKMVRALLALQENCCAYCEQPMQEYHVEHIVPLAVSGTNSLHNLVLSCARCNHIAGAKVFSSLEAKKAHILERRKQLSAF